MRKQLLPRGVTKLRDIPGTEKAVYKFESRISGLRMRKRLRMYPSQVEKAFKLWELELLSGKGKVKSPKLFGLLDRYLDEYVALRKSPSAYDHEKKAVELYKSFFADRPLAEFRRADVDAIIAWLLKSRTARNGQDRIRPGTVNRLLAPLGSFFEWARRLEYFERGNPVHGAKLPVNNLRRVLMTVPQIEEMMARAEEFDGELFAYMVLAIYAGFRRNEIFQLMWRDIDLGQRLIFLRAATTKTKAARAFKMSESVYAFMA